MMEQVDARIEVAERCITVVRHLRNIRLNMLDEPTAASWDMVSALFQDIENTARLGRMCANEQIRVELRKTKGRFMA